MKVNRWIYAAIVLLAVWFLYNLQDPLVRFAAYRQLYKHHPFYVPEGIKTSLEIILCVLVTALGLGKNFRRTPDELRLNRGFVRGVLFALIATAPLGIALAATHSMGKISWPAVAYLAFFAPFAEELVVRAYGFGQLHRRCGWPVWLAILVTAVIFGWGHIEKGSNFAEMAGLLLVTGSGGAFVAWFFYRWDSIWFPFALHALMNFYWEVFSVGRTALGGWFAVTAQISAILLAAFLTWKFARTGKPARAGAGAD
jgi:CAAX protease family protein